ncbi:hypothetical protein CJD36_018625 [Flavipsychrobacter stenotrophus]|uniref:Ig-like domain-containing protein n=1 Tax=Flavipsychrobacter stenotrophus TaxID=2077091 RepID=A0A2S7SRN3_9BACT|nr:GEVED domain-containing protein [Flavipsychrobacter stenotrophus]PQJ09265.1 hypothetical protein CJD36_018625 [Flavipsychrobacter stenotrophus]
MKSVLLFIFCLVTLNFSGYSQCSTTFATTSDCTYDPINTFSMGGVASVGNNNSNTCNSNGYYTFSTPVRTLAIGSTVTWSATVGNAEYRDGVGIWIDLNNNGFYESSEYIDSSARNYTHSRSFVMPGGITGVQLSMRVRSAYESEIRASQACTNGIGGGYGETENYFVILTNGATSLSATTSQTNLSCNAVCAGSASVTVSGGTAPYAYSWSPSGGTSATATGLCAGSYTCTITDGASATLTKTFTITQPPVLTSSVTAQSNVTTAGGSDGSATIAAIGGTPGYTYLWAPSGGTAASISGKTAGSYTCTITDANSCTLVQTVTLTQPAAPPANCGIISTIAGNGTAAYTGDGSLATAATLNTPTDVVKDAAGNIYVSDKDNNVIRKISTTGVITTFAGTGSAGHSGDGGPATAATLRNPTYMAMDGSGNLFVCDFTGGGFTFGGYIRKINSSGVISTIAGNLSGSSFSTNGTPATSANFFGISGICVDGSGNIYFSHEDFSSSRILKIDNGGALHLIAGSGGLTGDGQPATSTYLYNINGIAIDGSGNMFFCDANRVGKINAAGLLFTIAGSVSSPGHTGDGGAANAATLNDPRDVAVDGSGNVYIAEYGSSCIRKINSSGVISTFAGTTVAGYSGDGGAPAAAKLTAPTGISIDAGGSLYIADASINRVRVVGGCNVVTNVAPAYTLSAPQSLTVCKNNAAGDIKSLLHVNDADAGQTETWTQQSAPAHGTLVFTSATASSGSTNITPGGTITYQPTTGYSGSDAFTVRVSDGTATADMVVNVTVTAVTTSVFSQTNIACNGGSTGDATIAASGGSAPYTYSWAPGSATAATAPGLSAGTYTVTVSDANLCAAIQTVTLTQPSGITSSVSPQTNVDCNGNNNGAATVIASGVSGTLSYSWAPTGGTLATATGLTAGTYTCTITDGNACTHDQLVTITQPAALIATMTATTNVSCNGGSNGAATVTASGGTSSYTYSWAPTGGAAATATGLVPGTYTVSVTDANLCATTQTVTITQPVVLTASISATTNVSCNGGSNGRASVTVGGGTPSYNYSWAPSGGTAATALAAGSYTVTITDANSCTQTATTTITEPTALTASITATTNASCNGGNNGTATVTASGGTGVLNYSWLPVEISTATATDLTAGSYTVTVMDANLCAVIKTATIIEPTTITSSVTAQTNVDCNGNATGAAAVTASGGTGTLTYSWAPTGGTFATATGLTAGAYTCTITDDNLCEHSQTVTITQPTVLTSTISTQTNVTCHGGNNGAATVLPTGGTAPYTYS